VPDKTAPSTAPEDSQVAVTPEDEANAAALELDELRAQIQQKRDDRQRREQDISHDLRMTELDVEKARLVAELAAEEQLDKKLDSSSNNTFDNAEEALRAAVARAQATDDLAKAEAKAAADAKPNPLTDEVVPDGAAPSVAAVSVPATPAPAKATTTVKGK
jgi:hypothetical protein